MLAQASQRQRNTSKIELSVPQTDVEVVTVVSRLGSPRADSDFMLWTQAAFLADNHQKQQQRRPSVHSWPQTGSALTHGGKRQLAWTQRGPAPPDALLFGYSLSWNSRLAPEGRPSAGIHAFVLRPEGTNSNV